MHQEDEAWINYRARFAEIYDESNYESPLQAFVMRSSHRFLERAYGPDAHFSRVLEIGAGTGEHAAFVRHRWDRYVLTDMDPKALEIAKRKLANFSGSVDFECQVGDKLDYPDESFDRVIATHVLEHIPSPHLALKEWRRVVRHGGVLSVLIPTDPGIAWRLGRHLGPRRNALRQGIAYDYVMAREHVNSCINLVAILRHYFPRSAESWWPTRIPSADLNLFFAFHTIVRKGQQ